MSVSRLVTRAAQAALLTCSFYSLPAQAKSNKSETYQDIVSKAQNLVLQKDRQQALTILNNAITKESSRSQSGAELKKNLNELSSIFFDDKTQQLYEVAITLKRTDLMQAQQKIAEALRSEPDNILLLIEQVRILVARNECSSAEELAVKSRQQNAYNEELNLAYAQALLCLGNFAAVQKSIDNEGKKSSLSKFWTALELEKTYKEKNYPKASELLNALKKVDPKYPELDYWSWKLDLANKKKNSSAVEKYLMTCKNISAHLYRQYMIDPMVCRHMAEMESSGSE